MKTFLASESQISSDKRPGAGVDGQRGNMKLSWKKVNTKGRKTRFNSKLIQFKINSTQYIPRAIKIKIWRRFFTWILSSILVLGVEETKWARIVSGLGLTLIMVMPECWDYRFGEEIPRFMLSWELFVDFGIWEIAWRRGHWHFWGAS